ncbi:glutathione S-transferase GST-6.0 [Aspergillus leporis]|jgi:glutathione S-transferase|uniref:Glutathione S-transferase GST-6.0 n=1 Tax=Aspergillus leporis TaxID=41062 RepID=A0A5N5WV29_9EURO|nr:glutathione S-transferase GST-6.0 [Aspergillus leporis]
MPQITLYYSPDACSIIPHILLNEIGASFEAISIEMQGIDQSFAESFRQINPKSRVPVIALDNQVITEVPAVSTIISSLAPDAHLMGQTPLETARVYEWMNYVSGTVHTGAISHYFRPARWTTSTDGAHVDMIKERALENLLNCCSFIEDKLEGVYAVGDAFTAADAFLYFAYRWGKAAGIGMEVYPGFSALARSVEGRASVQTVLKSEQIHSIF